VTAAQGEREMNELGAIAMALVRRDAAGHDSHRVGRGLPAIKGSCARSLRLRNNLRACRSPGAGMEIAFLWFAFAIVVGVAASARGRNGIGWFVLALIISTLKAASVGGLFHFRRGLDLAPKFYPAVSSLLAFELPGWAGGATEPSA
jgi:hypothetical protein